MTGFDPCFERPACLAALKSSDRTKQYVCGWQCIYIYIYIYIYNDNFLTMMWYYSITFSDSLPIDPDCAHAVFERCTDKDWHNPSRTSSYGRGDPLEQSCLGVGDSKTRRTLRQQLTIIYCLMFRLHTEARGRKRGRERERESVRVCEQIQRDMHPSSPTELSECKLLTNNWLTG